MSQLEDNAQEISGKNPEERANTESEDGQKNGNGSGGILLFFIAGLMASLVVGWIVFPKLLYSRKEQPIDFNHVLHMQEVSNDCESCHFFRDDGSFAGVPKNEICAECHSEVLGESRDEEILVEEFILKDREVPWLIYSKQPDCVFFTHAAHVSTAEMDCKTCHGPIGESTSLKVYEENRITGYSRDIYGPNISGIMRNPWEGMKMDDCAACHREAADGKAIERSPQFFFDLLTAVFPPARNPSKDEACFVCHK